MTGDSSQVEFHKSVKCEVMSGRRPSSGCGSFFATLTASAMSTSSRSSMVGHFLLQTLAWFLFLLLASILTLFLLLLAVYKFVVDRIVFIRQRFTRRGARGSNGSIEAPILRLDVGFANDDFYGTPKGAIGFVSVFDGPLDSARVEESVTKLLTATAKNPSLKLNYDQLSSLVPTKAFGYSYWRRIEVPFNAKNHVRVLSSGSLQLNDIISKWIETPFKVGCPLWDILLIPCAPQTVLAVRIHHLIGDGYSLREFMENLFAVDSGDTAAKEVKGLPPPCPPIRSRATSLRLEFIWGAPLTFFKFIYDFFVYRDSLVTNPKLCQVDQIYATTNYSLAELKQVRVTVQNLLRAEDLGLPGVNFSFSSLIMYLFGNALARFWVERGRIGEDPSSLRLPSHLKVASSLPIDGEAHPTGLICNHWSHAIFEMPCRSIDIDVENPLSTLRTLAQSHHSVLRSGLPRIHTVIAQCHHILPNPIWRAMASLQIGTAIGFVNLPGPEPGVSMKFCGANMVQVTPIAGRQWKNAGMTIAAYSYNGVLSIGMLACRDLIKDPGEGALLLEHYFQDELRKLKDFLQNYQNTNT